MLLPRKGRPESEQFSMSSFFDSSSANTSSDYIFSTSSSRISIPALPSIPSQSSSRATESRGNDSSPTSTSPGTYYSLFSANSLSKNPSGHSPPQPRSYHAYGRVQPDQHQAHDLAQQMQGMHLAPGMPLDPHDPLDNMLGAFPCARLHGLPYDIHFRDVLLFFQGQYAILDVLVPLNPYRQGTGEAFVLFATHADFLMALQNKNRTNIRPGFMVEIFQGRRNDYHTAIASTYMHMGHTGEGEGHRGPMQVNTWRPQGEMANMPSQPPARNPHMHQGGNQAQGGFKIPVASGNQNSGTYKGSRPGRGKGGSGRGSSRGGGIQVGEHTGYLRMRGLPFTATKKEIYDFFIDYKPIEDSICLTYRSDGRATGEGYIVFSSPDGAKDAMALHRNTMGSRYIELFISNKEEHARAQAREPRGED